jgi:hypothetical protein
MRLAGGLVLAAAATIAFNWSWIAQHTAAAALPPLSLRRPFASLRLLLSAPRWTAAIAVDIGGWALYVGALAVAPLSLVQAIAAGGVGLLALLVQRVAGERLPRREWLAVGAAVVGLALLALSLVHGAESGGRGTWTAVAAWLAASAVAAAVCAAAAPRLAGGAGLALAAGTLYGAGDVGTKAAVAGGWRLLFVVPLLACYGAAFALSQLSFQRGGALATAGVATMLTNALPIAAGLAVFGEQLPAGALGGVRLAAFVLVVAGAAVLARR